MNIESIDKSTTHMSFTIQNVSANETSVAFDDGLRCIIHQGDKLNFIEFPELDKTYIIEREEDILEAIVLSFVDALNNSDKSKNIKQKILKD